MCVRVVAELGAIQATGHCLNQRWPSSNITTPFGVMRLPLFKSWSLLNKEIMEMKQMNIISLGHTWNIPCIPRSVFVSTMVADAMAPNRPQVISNKHADWILTSISCGLSRLHAYRFIAIKQAMVERGQEIGNPLFFIDVFFSQGSLLLTRINFNPNMDK